MIGGPGLKENCTQKMNYFLINLKGMENRFSNVFFVVPRHLKKNKFREQILVPAPRRRIGVSADIFGNYDTVYEEGSEYTKSKILLGLKYGVLFCHRLQK